MTTAEASGVSLAGPAPPFCGLSVAPARTSNAQARR